MPQLAAPGSIPAAAPREHSMGRMAACPPTARVAPAVAEAP